MREHRQYSFNGRKNQFGEYVVRCYKLSDDGKLVRHPDGDYFTNDKQDAINTKLAMENENT